MKQVPSFKVINWDVNRDCIEHYDIIPYILRVWDEEKKRKHKVWGPDDGSRMPETLQEFTDFVKGICQYQFWSRCEYEVIVHGWPVRRNDHKMDVYEQVEMNAEVIAKVVMDYLKK